MRCFAYFFFFFCGVKKKKTFFLFEITFEKPEDLEKMKVILQQSPKINDLKETIRKLVREALKEKFGKAK